MHCSRTLVIIFVSPCAPTMARSGATGRCITPHSDARGQIELHGSMEALLRHALKIVIQKITKEQQMYRVGNQDCDDAVLETFEPRLARDVFPCLPHEDTA